MGLYGGSGSEQKDTSMKDDGAVSGPSSNTAECGGLAKATLNAVPFHRQNGVHFISPGNAKCFVQKNNVNAHNKHGSGFERNIAVLQTWTRSGKYLCMFSRVWGSRVRACVFVRIRTHWGVEKKKRGRGRGERKRRKVAEVVRQNRSVE